MQKKLSLLGHAVSSRAQLPILLHLLLGAKEGKLSLSATDLEIGIEVSVGASIESEGAVAVPARLFIELINSLSTGRIALETREGKLEVIGKNTKSSLAIMPKDEFPLLYEEKGENFGSFKLGEFKKYLSRVIFATSGDTSRPSLGGILFKQEEKVLSFVATDGYRLSLQREIKSDMKGVNLDKPVVIPSRVMREVIGFKEGETISLSMSAKNNQVIFSQEEIVLVGRLLEAQFPNYEKILPGSYSTKVFFDKEDMQRAVKQCAIFARDGGNIVKFAFKENLIVVSAQAPSVGENRVEVDSRMEGEEKDIAFNVKYLLELFANIEAEELSFEMTGPLSPGVFRIADDPNFLHLVMPIKT